MKCPSFGIRLYVQAQQDKCTSLQLPSFSPTPPTIFYPVCNFTVISSGQQPFHIYTWIRTTPRTMAYQSWLDPDCSWECCWECYYKKSS